MILQVGVHLESQTTNSPLVEQWLWSSGWFPGRFSGVFQQPPTPNPQPAEGPQGNKHLEEGMTGFVKS